MFAKNRKNTKQNTARSAALKWKIEANKNIKEIVNTDTAIINCGAYGKGRIYHLEYTKLADSERGRL